MITSIQQVNKTRQQINALRDRLKAPARANVPQHIVAMEKAQVEEKIADLESEITEYEAACNADLNALVFDSYDDFLRTPIILRLAGGFTLTDFAEQVGISLRQLKRYEAEEYRNAPSTVVEEILEHYRLRVSGRISQAS